MNKWTLGFLSIALSFLGYHLGSRQVEEKVPTFKTIRIGDRSSDLTGDSKRIPTEESGSQGQTNLKDLKRGPQSQGALSGEKEREEEIYFRSHLADRENLDIYIKTKNLFRNYEHKEDLARWMVLGNFFSSSKSYGDLFYSSVRNLNEDPKKVLEVLKKSMINMGPKDSYLRGMAVNLVHHLELEDEEKVSFFGKEIDRPLKVSEGGDLGYNASSIVPSLLYLKQYSKDDVITVELLKKSLEKNQRNPKTQKSLRARYLAFFPNLAHRI
tara:strand:+ start:1305 stop:2111 length:807 start_codon:yes stop_codon:yes gene_type:complete